MKHRYVVIVAGVFLCAAALWADPPDRVGRLNFISGTVSFQVGGVKEWVPAVLNFPLIAGNELWTDEGGRTEIHVGSTAIRLDSRTELSFVNLDDQTTQAMLNEGSLAVRVRELDSTETFEVDTPNTSVSLLSPGSYRIDVSESGDTTVVVWSGSSRVAIGASALSLTSGQAALVEGTGIPTITMRYLPPQGDWDRWYMARDLREDRLVSVKYVPRGLIGCEDLDWYGTWEVIAGYGPVWIPSGIHAGWAPYRFGHWAWVGPWGWTWIDDAPWGFAPFHYGRWAFVGGRWVWVPGTIVVHPVYAPALVVFVGGDDWTLSVGAGIGWFPLGPHEVYVPPYTVSKTYLRNVNLGHIGADMARIDEARIRYVNRSLPHAVTVVPCEAFVRSEPVGRAAISVPETEIMRARVGGISASIVPRRESIIGQASPARPVAAQPPVRSRERDMTARPTLPRTPQEQPRNGEPAPQAPFQRVFPQAPNSTSSRNGGTVADDRSRADATALISFVRQRITRDEAMTGSARNASAPRQLTLARSLLSDAERELAAGNYSAAIQKANEAQRILDQPEKPLSTGSSAHR